MGIELKDFRGRITPETDCALEAEARSTGRDRQEIVREVMHIWALQKIHAANVMHKLLVGEGLPGIGSGMRGNVRDCEGADAAKGSPGAAR